MNVPNALTVLRICMTPVIVWAYYRFGAMAGGAVLVAAYITDFLDGYIARKYDMITKLGKALDPLADKLLMASILFCMVVGGSVPKWVVAVMLAQAGYLIVGSIFMLCRGMTVVANYWGKSATCAFFGAAVCLFPGFTNPYVLILGRVALYASLALMLCAAVSYTVEALHFLKEVQSNKN